MHDRQLVRSLQAAFEDAAQGAATNGGQASSSPAPEHGGQETVAERTTLADAASGLATQVVAGLRDGAAGVVSNVRGVVGRYAAAHHKSRVAYCHCSLLLCCQYPLPRAYNCYCSVPGMHWRKSLCKACAL